MTNPKSLTRTQLATLLSVDLKTIKSAIDEGAPGVIDRGGRGKSAQVDGPVFIRWWIERERSRAGGGGSTKQSKPHERETEVDIKLKELKFARESDQVLPKADGLFVVRDVFTQLNATMDAVPRRDGYRVIGLPGMADAVDALTTIMDQLRADLRMPEKWMPQEDEPTEQSALELSTEAEPV